MSQQVNINELTLLMNENSLSESTKKEITRKINKLLDFINYLSELKNVDNTLANNIDDIKNTLLKEQKSTARMIVKKNDSLSKNLIKSLTIQKENSLQVLEVSQLRLEAELKKLKGESTSPALKAEASVFNKIFSLFKVTFNARSQKAKINSTTLKLNDLEKQKENISEKFGVTGKESLKYLNRVTYNSFLPASDLSSKKIESIKNKITFLK